MFFTALDSALGLKIKASAMVMHQISTVSGEVNIFHKLILAITRRQNWGLKLVMTGPFTWWAHCDVAFLQMLFVLTDRPASDEHVALQTLHGAAYRHDNRVDLHCYLSSRSQHENLHRSE